MPIKKEKEKKKERKKKERKNEKERGKKNERERKKKENSVCSRQFLDLLNFQKYLLVCLFSCVPY